MLGAASFRQQEGVCCCKCCVDFCLFSQMNANIILSTSHYSSGLHVLWNRCFQTSNMGICGVYILNIRGIHAYAYMYIYIYIYYIYVYTYVSCISRSQIHVGEWFFWVSSQINSDKFWPGNLWHQLGNELRTLSTYSTLFQQLLVILVGLHLQ